MNIRVLRESGGIGDVVRILPAIAGLREKYPHAVIHVFIPPEYSCLVERAGDADKVFPTAPNRRPRLAPVDEAQFPYLNTGVKYDLTVDLYCPAFRHEADMRGEVWNDRIELFCKAADAWPVSLSPNLPITVAERDAARQLLEERGIPRKKGWIALQPFSTDPARDWPRESWRALADALARDGYGVFILDAFAGRTRDFPAPQVTGLPLLELAALLSVTDLLIAPDSGLAHLCGAVGGRALGLTASQSGAVLYRHYPRHSYIQPDVVAVQSAVRNPQSAISCRWPCYWSRPAECQRMTLKAAGRTCPCLARLSVTEVLEAAGQLLTHGDARTVMASVPFGEPPTDPQTVRSVASLLPPRARLLDVAGVLARSLRAAGARHDFRLEACHLLPIPACDRTEESAALFGMPEGLPAGNVAGGSPADWLWELFRVLKVGGRLIADERCLLLAGAMGFQLQARRPGFALFTKPATWPRRCDTPPP